MDRHNTQEPLHDKLTKSGLPIEFLRKKELFKSLSDKKMEEQKEIKRLQMKILEKNQNGENFDELYENLKFHEAEYQKFCVEQSDIIHQQHNQQQNHIKLLDKYIDDIHNDNAFLNLAEKEIRKNAGDDTSFLHRSELYNRSYNQMNSGHFPKNNKIDENSQTRTLDGRFMGQRPHQKFGGPNLKIGSNKIQKSSNLKTFKLQQNLKQNAQNTIKVAQNFKKQKTDETPFKNITFEEESPTFPGQNESQELDQGMLQLTFDPAHNDSEKCEMCGQHFVAGMLDHDLEWIGCGYDPCSKWYHIICVGITKQKYQLINSRDEDWFCSEDCKNNNKKVIK